MYKQLTALIQKHLGVQEVNEIETFLGVVLL